MPFISMNSNSREMVDPEIPISPVYTVTGAGDLLHLLEDVLEYAFERTDRTGESVRFGCFRMQGG